MSGRDHVNVAHVDPHAFDELVIGVLEGKLEEMRERPRYRDSGFVDDDGTYHARGGIHNDRSGRAAEGYTKQDVEDVRRSLRVRGLLMASDAVDAMLNEYVRTGRLNLCIVTTGSSPRPASRSAVHEVIKIGTDRYRVGSEVVRFNDRHVSCTCRPKRCEHEMIARRARCKGRQLPRGFPFADRRRQKLVSSIFEMMRHTPEVQSVSPGRPGYSTKQKLVALVLARLFRGDELQAAAAAAVSAGYFERFPVASLKRFRKDARVRAMLAKLGFNGADAIGQLIAHATVRVGAASDVA